jgi:putative ABC transport system permease protein
LTLSLADFAWKNVWRRRLRTCLTLCGIGMGIGAFVALVGFSRSFEQEWLKLYESSGTDIAVVQKTFMNTTVDQSIGPVLRAIPEVKAAQPMAINMMDLTSDINALIYGWPADSFEFAPLKLTQGRRFLGDNAEVMLGSLLADSLNKKAGDTLEIQGTTFQIVGVFHGGSALEAGALIMPLGQMQRLSSMEGKVTAFHVRLKPAAPGESPEDHMHRAQAAIEKALPGLRAVPAVERASNNQLVVLAHAAAWGTSAIALLVAALGIANTMAMSVFERTREIGVLRALGWRRRRVMMLILIEAAGLGLCGGVLGLCVGLGALHVLAAIPQTASVVSVSMSWSTLADALGISVLVGVLAGIAPAWRGARLSPVEAMRHE